MDKKEKKALSLKKRMKKHPDIITLPKVDRTFIAQRIAISGLQRNQIVLRDEVIRLQDRIEALSELTSRPKYSKYDNG